MSLNKKKFPLNPLLFTTLIISICSMVYELVIGSLSSYLLGDSVMQFSITIGLYLFAMGCGSFVSKYIEKDLFNRFVMIEILVGIVGGFSTMVLLYSFIYSNLYQFLMFIFIIGIGFLVGLEIPLLVRIIEDNDKNIKDGIADLFAFDYLGGLIGSLAFPLVLLPNLGYITVAFLSALLNMIAASIIVYRYTSHIKNPSFYKKIVIIFGFILLVMVFAGDKLSESLEGGLYRDRIIYSQQTQYQKIVMTKHKDDLRLFLNGSIQFSTIDEYRYHEPLVHIPMLLHHNPKKILLLGAGDGFATKELLKYESVEKIAVVDLDEQMVNLCKTNSLITKANENALSHEKVDLIYKDAFVFCQETKDLFDVVIIDLPDPDGEALSKLYSTFFYKIVDSILETDGIVVTQSSSPYYTSQAFWCISKTMEAEFKNVVPYHLYVPSFGDWGFNLASNAEIDTDKIQLLDSIETKYLTKENISGLFMFSKDEKVDMSKIEINTLVRPIITEYYKESVTRW